jgi:hypothetical protein
MEDVRKYAGGGPEAQHQDEALRAYQQEQYHRIANPAPGLESYPGYMARRAQETAAQAAVLGGTSEFAAVVGAPLIGSAHGVGQMARAPGKTFTRMEICAIIRGQMAITHDSHLRDLLTIFERLE